MMPVPRLTARMAAALPFLALVACVEIGCESELAGSGGATEPTRNGDHAVGQTSGSGARCPAAEDTTPIAKIAQPGFLGELEGCTVTTHAVFAAMGYPSIVPREYGEWVSFRLTDESGLQNTGFAASGVLVGGLVPKSRADSVFGLKRGDLVTVTGKVVALRWNAAATSEQSGASIFLAVDRVTKDNPEEPPKDDKDTTDE